jgi:hypothetical protein
MPQMTGSQIDDPVHLDDNNIFRLRELRLGMTRMALRLSDIPDHPLGDPAGDPVFPGLDQPRLELIRGDDLCRAF